MRENERESEREQERERERKTKQACNVVTVTMDSVRDDNRQSS
jgi:hypothetical protein